MLLTHICNVSMRMKQVTLATRVFHCLDGTYILWLIWQQLSKPRFDPDYFTAIVLLPLEPPTTEGYGVRVRTQCISFVSVAAGGE